MRSYVFRSHLLPQDRSCLQGSGPPRFLHFSPGVQNPAEPQKTLSKALSKGIASGSTRDPPVLPPQVACGGAAQNPACLVQGQVPRCCWLTLPFTVCLFFFLFSFSRAFCPGAIFIKDFIPSSHGIKLSSLASGHERGITQEGCSAGKRGSSRGAAPTLAQPSFPPVPAK